MTVKRNHILVGALVGSSILFAAGQALTQQAATPALPAAAQNAMRAPGAPANPNGIRVYIRSGLKTHGPGQHDYPQFLADYSKVLTEKGAVVSGGFDWPTADQLKNIDVIVMYKGDLGYASPADLQNLKDYVKNGGGMVSLHDALCGPDPAEWATDFVGGAKKHGEVNFTLEADFAYTVVDKASPLVAGLDGQRLHDEANYNTTYANETAASNGMPTSPAVHVLATTVIPDTPSARNATRGSAVGKVVPQIWTYEHTVPGGKPARAFVWQQGHQYENVIAPLYQTMLLRAIAYTAHRPVNELVDYKPPVRAPRQGGGQGGQRPAAPAAGG